VGPKFVLGLTPANYYQPRANFCGWIVQKVTNTFFVTGLLTDDAKLGKDGIKKFSRSTSVEENCRDIMCSGNQQQVRINV